jgi:hypothetical protein
MFIVWFEPLEIILYFAEAPFNAIEFVDHHIMCSSLLVVVEIGMEACNGQNHV